MSASNALALSPDGRYCGTAPRGRCSRQGGSQPPGGSYSPERGIGLLAATRIEGSLGVAESIAPSVLWWRERPNQIANDRIRESLLGFILVVVRHVLERVGALPSAEEVTGDPPVCAGSAQS